VQLLPERRRHDSTGETVHQHEFLADVEPALQELRLDAGEFGVAFEQRLQAARIELPQRLPQRDRLVRGLALAPDRRLRLARVAAREFGVQVARRFAQHFGDGRAFTRRERRGRDRAQLADDRFERLRNGREWQAVGPFRGAFRVGEREAHRIGAAGRDRRCGGERRSRGLAHHIALRIHAPPPAPRLPGAGFLRAERRREACIGKL